MGPDTTLGHGKTTGLNNAPAYIDLNELWAEVGLAGLEQLLTQHDIALANADHIASKHSNVLRFILFGDQRDEIELCANASANGGEA